MNVLIVEDVDTKYAEVRTVVASVLPADAAYSRASNLNEAEDAVMEGSWDLVVLDLSMDIAQNGSVDFSAGHASLGGLDVLERMSLLKIDHPTVLVTGFDSFQDSDRFDNAIMNLSDIDALASDWLGKSYLGCIRYGSEGWATKLARALKAWSKR